MDLIPLMELIPVVDPIPVIDMIPTIMIPTPTYPHCSMVDSDSDSKKNWNHNTSTVDQVDPGAQFFNPPPLPCRRHKIAYPSLGGPAAYRERFFGKYSRSSKLCFGSR